MRLSISAARAWPVADISAAADAATTAAGVLEQGLDVALGSALRPSEWHGKTHDAALARLRQEHDHAYEVRNVLQQIADEAADARTDLEQARRDLLAAVDEARRLGFTVTDEGTVSHSLATRSADAAAFEARIQQGLRVLDEVDELYGTRLDDLRADLASMILGQPEVTVPGLGTMDPDAMVRTLNSLDVDRRRTLLAQTDADDLRRLIQADPETMGNLNGVPFEMRGIANEISIRNALAGEIRTHGVDTARARMLQSFLEQRKAPYSSIQGDAPNAPLTAHTERVFVSFTDGDNPRLVEMVGALTPTTRNATVYVPGTGTNARGYGGGNWTAAYNLAEQTRGPVFIYLDGDFPQNVVNPPRLPISTNLLDQVKALASVIDDSAVDPQFALEMAPRLVDFGHALDAEIATIAPSATTTYLGHSYGGTIVGTADQLGLRADNIIHASSAGTGVLGPAATSPGVHRYTITAPFDPIMMSRLIPDNPLGDSPDLAGYQPLFTGRDGNGEWLFGLSAHGSYFNDPESDAFAAMVGVITGTHHTSTETLAEILDRVRDASQPTIGPVPPLPGNGGHAGPPGTPPSLPTPLIPDVPLRMW
ncbi:alpha/beta hydrolase [uncultured Gordonia sp.]|uniref:alpha/beta hydrolase n=1 Tax=uncultured Gordonia sp. TaxID=198437 RepID=UPI00258A3ECA|nr:alpha/beta hydrolase [uncultured Gordonia sp.]